MRYKIVIILLSTIISSVCISGGYCLWEKNLNIKGNIRVFMPEPEPEEVPVINELSSNKQNDIMKNTSSEKLTDIDAKDKTEKTKGEQKEQTENKEVKEESCNKGSEDNHNKEKKEKAANAGDSNSNENIEKTTENQIKLVDTK